MKVRRLGTSGLKVSEIGLGCNNFGQRLDLEATRRVVHRALDLGITLFDTADGYGNRGGSETQNLDAFKAKFKPAKTINILSADVIYKKPKHHNIEVHTLVAG